MRFRTEYRGSSFLELLQVDYPQLLPNLQGDLSQLAGMVPHGTTVLAFKFDGGVVVASDCHVYQLKITVCLHNFPVLMLKRMPTRKPWKKLRIGYQEVH